jgi:RNA polymerase sigma-70 factor, ECF subfamily
MGEVEAVPAGRDLVARARGGDASAFALLLDPLWEPAYRLAYSMLGDRTAAEDAVQEAGMKAWRAAGRLRDDSGDLRSWFLTIVANQCRSIRRTRWWRVLPLARLPEEAEAAPATDARLDLERALAGLSSQHREVLALRYFLDLSVDEVARVLGISVSATKSRLHRALRALGPALE